MKMKQNLLSIRMMNTRWKKLLRFANAHGGEVTVISVGSEDSETQLRTALAMGADKAVLILAEEELEYGDQVTTSKILAAFLKDKEVDLILVRKRSH